MGDYRSSSFSHGDMQIERYYEGRNNPTTNSQDFRSYSASYEYSSYHPPAPAPTQLDGVQHVKDLQLNKGKSVTTSWSFSDPEFQRKKRVASYKVYAVEGKVKGSFRKSFRWIKDRYSRVIYGWL